MSICFKNYILRMELKVNIRKEITKQQNKLLRKGWNVPAIVYGKHLKANIQISCLKNEFIKKYKEAGYSTPITLNGEWIDELVLIQDIQLDPVTDVVLHVDFLAVKKDEKVKTEVPIVLIWESPIEKLWEWKIQMVKDFIEVEAFPQDLPHDIKIDISKIATTSDTIFVKDIKVSKNVKILDDLEQPIITVVSLNEEVEEAPATPTAAATTTTETKAEPAKK